MIEILLMLILFGYLGVSGIVAISEYRDLRDYGVGRYESLRRAVILFFSWLPILLKYLWQDRR